MNAISDELVQRLKTEDTKQLLSRYINCTQYIDYNSEQNKRHIALLTELIFDRVIINYNSENIDKEANYLDIDLDDAHKALFAVTTRIENNISDPAYRHKALKFIACVIRLRRNLFKHLFQKDKNLLIDLTDNLLKILKDPNTINKDRLLVLLIIGRLSKTVQDDFLFNGPNAVEANNFLTSIGQNIRDFFNLNLREYKKCLFTIRGELISEYFIAVQKIAMKVKGDFKKDVKADMKDLLSNHPAHINMPFLQITPTGNGREVLFNVMKSFGFLAEKEDFGFLLRKIKEVKMNSIDHIESLLRSILYNWKSFRESEGDEVFLINDLAYGILENILENTASLRIVSAIVINYIEVGDFQRIMDYIDLHIGSDNNYESSKAACAAVTMSNDEYINEIPLEYISKIMDQYSYKVSVSIRFWKAFERLSSEQLIAKGIDSSVIMSFMLSNLNNLHQAIIEGGNESTPLKDKINCYYEAFRMGLSVLDKVIGKDDFLSILNKIESLSSGTNEMSKCFMSDEHIMNGLVDYLIKKSKEHGIEETVFYKLLNFSSRYDEENPIRKHIISQLSSTAIVGIDDALLTEIEKNELTHGICEILVYRGKADMLKAYYENKMSQDKGDNSLILQRINELQLEVVHSKNVIMGGLNENKTMLISMNNQLSSVFANSYQILKQQNDGSDEISKLRDVFDQLYDYQTKIYELINKPKESTFHMADSVQFKIKLPIPGIDLSIDVKNIIKAIDDGYLKNKLMTPKELWKYLKDKFIQEKEDVVI